MKKGLFLLILLLSVFGTYSQSIGVPIWLFVDGGQNELVVTDWRDTPPSNSIINSPNIVSNSDATGVAFDKCGDIAFFVSHNGSADAFGLYIYNSNGEALLDNSVNSPGLNSISKDGEIQIVKVPTFDDEWYIIYKLWRTPFGSPNSDGNNAAWYIAYSRIRYDGETLTVLERDINLLFNNQQFTYQDGKAVSKKGPIPNSHYLYLCRRKNNWQRMDIHRFVIDANGITSEENATPVYTEYWNLTNLASPLELSPTDATLAAITRQPFEFATPDLFIIDTTNFGDGTDNIQPVVVDNLILQPDGVNILSPKSITDASNQSGLGYLKNLGRNISWIEFSPDGRYLYAAEGGFAVVGNTHVSYLIQIDLTSPYPYEVRIQAQKPPTTYNVLTGAGCPTASCIDDWNKIVSIQSAPDGNLYFRKWNTTKLFVIPNPNDPMPQRIIPGVVDLATPANPNIELNKNVGIIPDQIDGFNYINLDVANLNIVVRKEPCAGDCINYTLNINNPMDTEASYSLEACSAENYFDTISICVDDDITFDLEEVNGITYEAAIVNGEIQYPQIGYFDFSIDPNDFTIQLGNDTTICAGNSVILDAGSGFTTYDWSTGASSQSITVNNSGQYVVTGTTSDGCLAVDTITVSLVEALDAPNLGSDFTVCENFSDTLDAGSGYTTYSWNTGASTQTLIVNQAGTYTVTVTDSCENELSDNITITDGTLAAINLGDDTTFCGDVNLVLDAGAGFDTYDWSTGASSQTITVTNAGEYSVEVTSTAGCSATGSIEISSITPLPEPDLGNDISICGDTSITLNPGNAPYVAYLWSNNATSSTISISTPGTYSVTVTDSCGREMMDEITITDASVSEINLGNDTTFCGDVNLVLDAGAGFDTYDWSTGASSQTITVTSAGEYSVEVTSTAGCSATDSIEISSITPLPEPDLGNDIAVCGDTTITLNPGNAPYVAYLWSNNATSSTISISTPGTYAVTVTDSCGREMMDEITITDASVSEINLGNDTTFCGDVNLVLDAGSGFDTYDWSTGASSQTITVTSAGQYSVDVTSTAGCSATGSIEISSITPLPEPDLGNDIAVCGDTTITLNPGNAPYVTYLWSNNATSSTISISTPGTYSVTVTDSCGREMMDEITITDASVSEINLGNDTTFCGDVNLVLDAGAGFDTYDWSNGASSQTITVTSAGEYSVEVSSSAGCESSGSISISSITPSPAPNLGNDTLICGDISLLLSPGAGPYTSYLWNDNSTNSTLAVNAPGTYSVTVTDSCGNEYQDAIEITGGSDLNISGLLNDVNECASSSIQFDGTTQGVTSYQWYSDGNPIGTNPTVSINVTNSTLIVLVVSNACGSSSDTAQISVFEAPTATIVSDDISLCTASDEATIQIALSGGTAPYSLTISNGSSTETFNGIDTDTFNYTTSEAGTYTITEFTDENCDGEAAGSVSVNSTSITFDIEQSGDACEDREGSIQVLNVSGGDAPYQFSLNGGTLQDDSSFDNLGSGSYSVTVVDANGCEATSATPIELEFSVQFDINAVGDTTIVAGESAPISVTISPAIDNPSISWSPSTDLSCDDCENPIASPNETTTYSVTVTDQLGCSETENVTIEVEQVECNVYVPNAFSPNGDGQNDVMFVRLNGEYLKLDFRIYNRWGELVFQTDDITIGWDGYFKGTLQNSDVFGYYMELECITNEIIQQQGNITLLR